MTALLGFAWLGGSVAAFLIGGVITGERSTPQPGPPGSSPRGVGACLVGLGAAYLVYVVGAQISILRDRRRHPKARYRRLHGFRYYTIPQALRANALLSPVSVLLVVLGLWMRHRYG